MSKDTELARRVGKVILAMGHREDCGCSQAIHVRSLCAQIFNLGRTVGICERADNEDSVNLESE